MEGREKVQARMDGWERKVRRKGERVIREMGRGRKKKGGVKGWRVKGRRRREEERRKKEERRMRKEGKGG